MKLKGTEFTGSVGTNTPVISMSGLIGSAIAELDSWELNES